MVRWVEVDYADIKVGDVYSHEPHGNPCYLAVKLDEEAGLIVVRCLPVVEMHYGVMSTFSGDDPIYRRERDGS